MNIKNLNEIRNKDFRIYIFNIDISISVSKLIDFFYNIMKEKILNLDKKEINVFYNINKNFSDVFEENFKNIDNYKLNNKDVIEELEQVVIKINYKE